MGGAPTPKWDPKTALTHSHMCPGIFFSPPFGPPKIRPSGAASSAGGDFPAQRHLAKDFPRWVKTVLGSHFGVVYFSGDWDAHWGLTRILTHLGEWDLNPRGPLRPSGER